MEQFGPRGIDWRHWTRNHNFESDTDDRRFIRLEILSLRSSLNQMREERLSEELRSKVERLWKIGCNVLLGYKYGGQCIEMVEMLAFLNSISVKTLNLNLFGGVLKRNLMLMLKDLGFLIMTTEYPPSATLFSTGLSALMDEIRQKNPSSDEKLLDKIMVLISHHVWHPVSHEVMTSIWQQALAHGITFIRHYSSIWGNYLKHLLQFELHGLNDGQKEIVTRAVVIFGAEFGNTDRRTMELRFNQLRLFLREEDVGNFLNQSSHYRSLLETILTPPHVHVPRGRILSMFFVPIPMRGPRDRKYPRTPPKNQQIAELIYERALQMNDPNSKKLLLQESLAHCNLGNNLWRSTFPNNSGNFFFSWRLKCLVELGRWDEIVVLVKEIREMLMDPPLLRSTTWFPDAVLQSEGVRREVILNELSILLNHFFNIGFPGEDLLKSLIKCESGLRKWDRILVVMREKRGNWREDITTDKVKKLVEMESTILDLMKHSMNDLILNDSLEFTKHLVEFLINDGAYGEKYLAKRLLISDFQDDPLVLFIKTSLFKNRYEELLNYMLEYEKLLEEKYGVRVGPITNGVLLFGQWVTSDLKNQNSTGEKFKALLQGVKTTTQNRMLILSNHPLEKEPWMEEYADLISKNCDSFLPQN